MSKEFAIQVPDDTYEELEQLDSDRLDEVMVGAVREALDTVDTAEAKRDELHARRRGEYSATEELAGDSEEPQTVVEKRQAELREKMGPH
mgnify:CR=1 FL=1